MHRFPRLGRKDVSGDVTVSVAIRVLDGKNGILLGRVATGERQLQMPADGTMCDSTLLCGRNDDHAGPKSLLRGWSHLGCVAAESSLVIPENFILQMRPVTAALT